MEKSKVIKPVTAHLMTDSGFKNYCLQKMLQKYDSHVLTKISTCAKKTDDKQNTVKAKPLDPISVHSSLSIANAACDRNSFDEGAVMWLL